MATSVTAGFNEMRDGFPLTKIQNDSAATKFANIRDFFNEKFTMAEPAIAVGSCARGSIIRIERDIDILAPISYSTYKKTTYDRDSQAFLYMVRDALNNKFGTTSVSSKRVAVKLDFSTIAVDVVPCFRREGGCYFMPDGSGAWMPTNPPFHTEFMRAANAKHQLRLRPLVKLMKFWNISNGHHLSSLHVELMTERIWRDSNFRESLYSQLVFESLKCMASWTKTPFSDPWDQGHAIDVNLPSKERALAIRMLNEDAENARKAEEFRKNGQIEQAFDRWAVIFNHKFPAFG